MLLYNKKIKIVGVYHTMSIKILALDTTTEAHSVALINNEKIDARFEIAPRLHTQRILPIIKELLYKQNMRLGEIDLLAFGHGPGSFTGIRIAISITQGLALGAHLPIVGISSLVTMAQSAWNQIAATHVLAGINARMGEIYWAEYQRNDQGIWTGKETILSIKIVLSRIATLKGKWAIVGNIWKIYPELSKTVPDLQLIETNIILPIAKDMLPLASRAWQRREIKKVEDAIPVYLRNEIAWAKNPNP
ncbi:peptidase YeaZ [Candidatus Pantoea carbekii]|nr:peptidase YeaZ [Candidatus Pantoea carbekii]